MVIYDVVPKGTAQGKPTTKRQQMFADLTEDNEAVIRGTLEELRRERDHIKSSFRWYMSKHPGLTFKIRTRLSTVDGHPALVVQRVPFEGNGEAEDAGRV